MVPATAILWNCCCVAHFSYNNTLQQFFSFAIQPAGNLHAPGNRTAAMYNDGKTAILLMLRRKK